MFNNGAVFWQRACGNAVLVFPDGVLRRPSARRRIAKGQEIGFLFVGCLVVLTVCLAVGFVACIVLEAFDLDPDLWPFGARDFNVAFQAQHLIGGPAAGAIAVLIAIQCFVKTAGAHLVWRHRARSDLAAVRPSICIAFTVAEPWWLYVMVTPVLGHPVSWIQLPAANYADERGRQTPPPSRARCLP
jgi:hypothetical protein